MFTVVSLILVCATTALETDRASRGVRHQHRHRLPELPRGQKGWAGEHLGLHILTVNVVGVRSRY